MSWQFNTTPLLNSEALVLSCFFHSFVFCVTLCSAGPCQLLTQCCTSAAGSASPRSRGLASCRLHRAGVWSRVPTACLLCYRRTKRFLLPVPCPSPWFVLMWANLLDSLQRVWQKEPRNFLKCLVYLWTLSKLFICSFMCRLDFSISPILGTCLIWSYLLLHDFFFVMKVLTSMRCLFLW